METQIIRYHSPALDAFLKSSFEELNDLAKIEAQRFALINRPALIGDKMTYYFEGLHLKFHQLNDKVEIDLQYLATCHNVTEHRQTSDNSVQDLQNKKAEAKEKQAELNTKHKNTSHQASLKRFIVPIIAVLLISLFEGVQTIPVYEVWGFNFAEAILMGLLFAGVLTILAHTILKIIFLGSTIWRRRLIGAILLALLIALFTYMANVRAEYLSSVVNANAANSVNIHFSPLPFVFISVLLFIVSVAVCHFYMPTQGQRDAIRAYHRLQKERKAIAHEIAQFDASLLKVQEDNSMVKNESASVLVYGAMLEELIINNAKSCYALWKHQNLFHRKDNGKPDCFDEPYPFTFNTNFHSIKLLNHEKAT